MGKTRFGNPIEIFLISFLFLATKMQNKFLRHK